jgi:hypothetical protein
MSEALPKLGGADGHASAYISASLQSAASPEGRDLELEVQLAKSVVSRRALRSGIGFLCAIEHYEINN